MSKYDFPLKLTERNNITLLLKMVKPNSNVLEFGPAAGRMTKYLKEKLNCKVSIVEIDEEAYNKAKLFCEKAFLGDIENYEWVPYFEGMKFDYIIFADVLEHLSEPDKAVLAAKKFLREDGNLLISVPNIAHNAVISDLMFGKFKYKDLGILDNTHIKHFTYSSLCEMVKQCGFGILKSDFIRIERPAEFTNSIDDLPFEVADYLHKRKGGNIYQILLRCVTAEYYEKQLMESDEIEKYCALDTPFISSTIYLDNGKGYNENNYCTAYNEGSSNYHIFNFDLSNKSNILKIRWDPIESLCCRCKLYNINSDGIINSVTPINNYNVEDDGTCEFLSLDPYYEIIGDFKNATYIKIEAKLEILPLTEAVNQLNKILYAKDAEISGLKKYVKEKDIYIEMIGNIIKIKEAKINQLTDYINRKEEAVQELIKAKEAEINQLTD